MEEKDKEKGKELVKKEDSGFSIEELRALLLFKTGKNATSKKIIYADFTASGLW